MGDKEDKAIKAQHKINTALTKAGEADAQGLPTESIYIKAKATSEARDEARKEGRDYPI